MEQFIAAYGTVSEFARILGEAQHVSLVEETLQEEKETDEKLTSLAKEINPQANQDSDGYEATKATRRTKRAGA